MPMMLHLLKTDGSVEEKILENAPSLEDLQKGVEGYIETVPGFTQYEKKLCVAFCNEEGKLQGLKVNEKATFLWWEQYPGIKPFDALVGNVVVITGSKEQLERL